MISQVLNWISGFFQNVFGVVLDFLGELLGYLVQGLITVLKLLFRPIFVVIGLIFYILYKIGQLVLLLFKVLLAIGKLVYSFITGLIKTLVGITWTPSAPDHGEWSSAIGQVFQALAPYQLDKIAYVLLFVIWMLTAWAAIKILTGRGAADDD